jgi:hypothetical protein
MSEFDDIINHQTVIECERDGPRLILTLKSSESNHHVVRKIESADGFILSSPLECDIDGAVKLKVIATKYR